MKMSEHKSKLPAALLVSTLAASLVLPALGQQSRTHRLKFKRNQSSAVVEDAVIRGTTERYVVGARAGQRMDVRITSLENNAVFHILQPGGRRTLSGAGEMDDATRWSGRLPRSGDYTLVVGGTRGNATFKLRVAIR